MQWRCDDRPVGCPDATFTTMVKVTDAFGGERAAVVHWTVAVPVQSHPLGALALTRVSPVGSGSDTSGDCASDGPVLVSSTV